jgi:hypothetical protein
LTGKLKRRGKLDAGVTKWMEMKKSNIDIDAIIRENDDLIKQIVEKRKNFWKKYSR